MRTLNSGNIYHRNRLQIERHVDLHHVFQPYNIQACSLCQVFLEPYFKKLCRCGSPPFGCKPNKRNGRATQGNPGRNPGRHISWFSSSLRTSCLCRRTFRPPPSFVYAKRSQPLPTPSSAGESPQMRTKGTCDTSRGPRFSRLPSPAWVEN